MNSDPAEIELIEPGSGPWKGQDPDNPAPERPDRRAAVTLLALVTLAVGLLLAPTGQPTDEPSRDSIPTSSIPNSPVPATEVKKVVPPALLAAELFAAAPSPERLRGLFDAIDGWEGINLGIAEGAFDLVRFDPVDQNRLLASHRSSYGPAENQLANEVWHVTPAADVEQAIWEPTVGHDFVHFNIDGTTTMWIHGGGSGFAPRVAVTLDRGLAVSGRSEPVYASRFTSAGGTLFALTGNGDYYSNDATYVDLVADDGTGIQILDDGAGYAWIDNPTAEIMVAYPIDEDGSLAVWSTGTLESLPLHPLAGRPYRRVAVSGDGTVAVGATFDDKLELLDLTTGLPIATFGDVDVTGVDQPLTLSHDGTIAVTVDATGTVSMWWVGEDEPIASVDAYIAQPRWVSDEYAPGSASVVSPDASRVALLAPARPSAPVTWTIVDLDPASWIERACLEAGRPLTAREADELGLPAGQTACFY